MIPKTEILAIIFTLVPMRFCLSMADGMCINKTTWLKRHLVNWLGRDAVIAAVYIFSWETANDKILLVPLLYAVSLNWSLHVIAYYLGDTWSSYQRGIAVGLGTMIMGIGALLCIVAGACVAAFVVKDFYSFFGFGMFVGLLWVIAYQIAYKNFIVQRKR